MERQMARKLVVDEAPNRLFLKYLSEWRDEAKEKGDKSMYTYGKAFRSLKKYPLPLQCGSEAKILENFGDKICKMLDDRLSKDAEDSGVSSTEFLEKSRKVPQSWWEKINKEPEIVQKKQTKRKKTTQNENKEPAKKKISPPSRTIAEMFGKNQMQPGKEPDDVIKEKAPVKGQVKSVEVSSSADHFVLSPGQFDVVLVVDTRETMGESRRKEMGVELSKQNVCYEQRVLHIGDFLWIAQEKPQYCIGRKPRELVLDYIIERKIPSDLAMSIRDGRFREQKIRLKNSGISNIIYLIENTRDIEHQSLPEQTLRQAIYNTQIVDNICIKFTKNAKVTATYLDLMTKRLGKLYENKTLEAADVADSQNDKFSETQYLTPFSIFNEMGSKVKKLTVKEMFLRQLMQIHGVSYDKASVITEVYPTPTLLVQKYQSLTSIKEKEELLSKLKFGISNRNLGIAISRVIYKVYNS